MSRFVYASNPLVPDFVIRGGTTYRIVSDQLGSPRLVVDVATGAVAQRLRHDEFGNVLEDTAPGFVPFGFAGGLYDADTGLVRFGARDYDPGLGRWISKDPSAFAGGDANLYTYSGGDPVNNLDQDGRFWKTIKCWYYVWKHAELVKECDCEVERACEGDGFFTNECQEGSGGYYSAKQQACIRRKDPGAAFLLIEACGKASIPAGRRY